MRALVAVLCLAVANPAVAGPATWLCKTKFSDKVWSIPAVWEEKDGMLISPPADITGLRTHYKITQESEDGLIAEASFPKTFFPPGNILGEGVVVLNKKTGEMRAFAIGPQYINDTGVYLDPFISKCVAQ